MRTTTATTGDAVVIVVRESRETMTVRRTRDVLWGLRGEGRIKEGISGHVSSSRQSGRVGGN